MNHETQANIDWLCSLCGRSADQVMNDVLDKANSDSTFSLWLNHSSQLDQFVLQPNHPLGKRMLTGINSNLFSWAVASDLYKMAVGYDVAHDGLLEKALGPNETNRYIATGKLMDKVWETHPTLGFAPDYGLLAALEHEGSFYPKYRDHLTHMFKVFLLGLYLYEKHDAIHTSVNNIWQNKEDFLNVWILTALWHDIGYLIENEDGARNDNAAKTMNDRLNEDLKYPLTKLYKPQKIFAEGSEEGIRECADDPSSLYPPEVKGLDTVERMLDRLKGFGRSVRLTPRKTDNPVEVYYHYLSQKRKDREYYDHGIVSACLLLFVQHSLCTYIEKCKNVVVQIEDNPDPMKQKKMMFANQRDTLDTFLNSEDKYKKYAQKAAEAISIHNLKKIMDTEDMKELNRKGVTIGELQIKLESEPIIYLLRLCDELQCWDRQHFKSPEEYTVGGESLEFFVEDEQLTLMMDAKIKKKFLSAVADVLIPPVENLLNISNA